jgi:hypothetical protein
VVVLEPQAPLVHVWAVVVVTVRRPNGPASAAPQIAATIAIASRKFFIVPP